MAAVNIRFYVFHPYEPTVDGFSFLALTISIKDFQFVTLVLKRLIKFGH